MVEDRQLGSSVNSLAARQLGRSVNSLVAQHHSSAVRHNASSAQRQATTKPPLDSDYNTRIRVGRHFPPGNTARPDRYGQSFMAIGSLIYGDKKCALSALYANWLKAWKEREGCCPFHLLLPVRVRIDGTSPHLSPLTKRMNEERSLINTHGISPMRGTQDTTHKVLYILSFLSSSSCLVFSELTQASECLRLTTARASDPSLSPSFSGSWSSAFPIPRSVTLTSSQPK
ncbi:hypothetical protein AAC387_Pa02g2337 [Persea americana]